MRIGVFSDTHGDISALSAFLNELGKLDCIFHLGDYSRDASRLAERLHCPFHAVRGNCDYSSDAPYERILELQNKRFFLTHGHRYADEYALAERAEKNNCDAIFYGHSHVPSLSAQGKILICNPGSLSKPRYCSKRSCALVVVEEDVYIKLLSAESSISKLRI
ncbi:MAG: metallophosphoesterase [Clostridia bacterium]|nr:metallophosphoesterase [Clostridia bacterium]